MKKLNYYHHFNVPHDWIVDPMEESLSVFRWTRDGYLLVLAAVMQFDAATPGEAALGLQAARATLTSTHLADAGLDYHAYADEGMWDKIPREQIDQVKTITSPQHYAFKFTGGDKVSYSAVGAKHFVPMFQANAADTGFVILELDAGIVTDKFSSEVRYLGPTGRSSGSISPTSCASEILL